MSLESENHVSPYHAALEQLEASGAPSERGFLLPQLLTKLHCTPIEREQLLSELDMVFNTVGFWEGLSADLQTATDPSISVEKFLYGLDRRKEAGSRVKTGKYHPYSKALSMIYQDPSEKEKSKLSEYLAFHFIPVPENFELEDIVLQTRKTMRDNFANPNRWLPFWRRFDMASAASAHPGAESFEERYPAEEEREVFTHEAEVQTPMQNSPEPASAEPVHAVLRGSSLSIGSRFIELTPEQRKILLVLSRHPDSPVRHSVIASVVYEGKGFSHLSSLMNEMRALRRVIARDLGRNILSIVENQGIRAESQLTNCNLEVVLQEEKQEQG